MRGTIRRKCVAPHLQPRYRAHRISHQVRRRNVRRDEKEKNEGETERENGRNARRMHLRQRASSKRRETLPCVFLLSEKFLVSLEGSTSSANITFPTTLGERSMPRVPVKEVFEFVQVHLTARDRGASSWTYRRSQKKVSLEEENRERALCDALSIFRVKNDPILTAFYVNACVV